MQQPQPVQQVPQQHSHSCETVQESVLSLPRPSAKLHRSQHGSYKVLTELHPDSERSRVAARSVLFAEFQLNRESELHLFSGAAARASIKPRRSQCQTETEHHTGLAGSESELPLFHPQPSAARRARAWSPLLYPVSEHRSSESELPTRAPICYPPPDLLFTISSARQRATRRTRGTGRG